MKCRRSSTGRSETGHDANSLHLGKRSCLPPRPFERSAIVTFSDATAQMRHTISRAGRSSRSSTMKSPQPAVPVALHLAAAIASAASAAHSAGRPRPITTGHITLRQTVRRPLCRRWRLTYSSEATQPVSKMEPPQARVACRPRWPYRSNTRSNHAEAGSSRSSNSKRLAQCGHISVPATI
jgi:hypothetical protein